jgi:amino acid adenylation domain-containing protein
LASVFGILKAAAAYVPVDVSAPPARNAYIFNDCDVAAIIVDGRRADALEAALGGQWTRAPFPSAPAHPANFVLLFRSARPQASGPSDLAYLLYTSGSTGRPKGVMHSHATAMAFIDWCSSEFAPTAADRFSSHAPFHFDLSILDIYVPIKHGASVVLIGNEAGKQPGTLVDVIEKRAITVWYSTPSILRMLVEYGGLEEHDLSALRIVNFAGEVFPIKHLRALMRLLPAPAYYNLYGPTETNVCTFHKVDPAQDLIDDSRSLPIGRVCSGDSARVVDGMGNDAAANEEGELLVAGGSVMLGYWNLPERNADAFQQRNGANWYRTGDIVRERLPGQYEFLGRRDRMVKKRGFRVELGEIEAALHRHPQISEAATLAIRSGDGEIQIAAFIVWEGDGAPSIIKMKQFCAENLPLYMTPDRFTFLPALPKTSTDKIDYQRLLDAP